MISPDVSGLFIFETKYRDLKAIYCLYINKLSIGIQLALMYAGFNEEAKDEGL